MRLGISHSQSIAWPVRRRLQENECSVMDEVPQLTVPFREGGKTMKQKSSSTRVPMKHFATVALMLNIGVASLYAQQMHVTFSGTSMPSTVVLKSGVDTSEYNFAGNGPLGPFTFHTLSASGPSQAPPSTPCAFYGSVVAGGGVFRFQDGSLLMVNSAQGTDCIQLTATGLVAHCVRIFKVAGGTGRFRDLFPGGSVTLDETLVPVVSDGSANPVFFAAAGTGTISGVPMGQGSQDRQP